MTIVLFFLVLALLIFVHELGHFLAAKAVGARVDEFGLGFPPKVFSYKWGETVYSLNLLPFGGFVKIYGETLEEDEKVDIVDKNRNLSFKPKWQQAVVLVAGVVFNMILAWLLFSVGLMSGLPMSTSATEGKYEIENEALTVIAVNEETPASKAGLEAGDEILYVENEISSINSPTVEEFQNIIQESEESILLRYERNEEIIETSIRPEEEIIEQGRAIGVALDMAGIVILPWYSAFIEGFVLTIDMTRAMVFGFVDLVDKVSSGQAELKEAVAGPVGIAGMVGDASRLGFVYLMTFTAFISINLAIINLLPLPALDGGRLLFILIEKIKGSPINPKIANTLNFWGFVFLLGLMLLITVGDISRLF